MPFFQEEFRIGRLMRAVPARDRREVVSAVSQGRQVDSSHLASLAVEYARFVQRIYEQRRQWPLIFRTLWRFVHITGRRRGLEGTEEAAKRAERVNAELL